MIDRSEKVGLVVALAGHAALFGILSVGFLATPNPLKLESKPVEVTLIDEVGLEATAPEISSEEPAAKLAPENAPLEPEAAPPETTPAPPEPQPKPPKPEPAQPQPKPQPAPPKPAPPKPAPPKPAPAAVPAPKAKPQPPTPAAAPAKPTPAKPAAPAKPTPAKPAAAAPAKPSTAAAAAPARPSKAAPSKPTGRLDGIVSGLTDKPTTSKSTTPPATAIGPQVKAALASEVLRQVKPKWSPPSGADSELLRTTVQIRLNEDGSIDGEPRVTQTGVTEGNRVQAALHRERAIRAVKLAAPFKLPPQYYDAWKTIAPTLYEGL